MAINDRKLENQDQPGAKPLDRSHPYYGPDSYALQRPIRDQPRPGRRGFWERVRSWLGG